MMAFKRGVLMALPRGRAEGEKEARIDMALKLLNLGIDVDTIVTASGLSKEEVEKLK